MTQYYLSDNEDRQKEIDFCLEENCNNKYIDKIYLFLEKDLDLNKFNSDKIEKIIIYRRLDYSDCFKFSNEKLKDQICIIANSDIIFTDDLAILRKIDFNNLLLAITRHEIRKDGKIIEPKPYTDLNGHYVNLTPEGSQDAWIYKTPFAENIKTNFQLGTPHCERRLAYQLKINNINLLNPYKIIKIKHLHLSMYRTYLPESYKKYGNEIAMVPLSRQLP